MSYLDDLGVAATRPQVQRRPPVCQTFKHSNSHSYSKSYSNRFRHRESNGQKQWPRGEPNDQRLLHGLVCMDSVRSLRTRMSISLCGHPWLMVMCLLVVVAGVDVNAWHSTRIQLLVTWATRYVSHTNSCPIASAHASNYKSLVPHVTWADYVYFWDHMTHTYHHVLCFQITRHQRMGCMVDLDV